MDTILIVIELKENDKVEDGENRDPEETGECRWDLKAWDFIRKYPKRDRDDTKWTGNESWSVKNASLRSTDPFGISGISR